MSIDRKIGLELRDGQEVGRDPNQMRAEELGTLGHSAMSPLKALRLRCIDCSAGSSLEVRLCKAVSCPSWPFRLGRSPWRPPASEAQRAWGRRLAARSTEAFSEKGENGGRDVPATTLPDAIDGEKYPLNLVGKEEGA